MNINLLNTQIESLNPDHGKEIIKFYKNQGFDTKDFTGMLSKQENDPSRFYGVNLKGKFSSRLKSSGLNTITLEEGIIMLANDIKMSYIIDDNLLSTIHKIVDDKLKQLHSKTLDESSILEILEKNNLDILNICNQPITVEGNIIKVPLPSANKNWTFNAWDTAKEICNLFKNAYPVHKDYTNYDDSYIYIKVYKK